MQVMGSIRSFFQRVQLPKNGTGMDRNWRGERSLEISFLKTGESKACFNDHRNGLVKRERLHIQTKEGITESVGHGKARRGHLFIF